MARSFLSIVFAGSEGLGTMGVLYRGERAPIAPIAKPEPTIVALAETERQFAIGA